MLDIKSAENNELKKYLDSYKRLFFRKQLDNPKSRLILEKKRESLGLSKEEVDKVEMQLMKNLNDAIDFIAAMIDLNASTNLLKDDVVEINVYCKDLGLSEDDISLCMEAAKSLSSETLEKKEATDKDIQNQEERLGVPIMPDIEGDNLKKSKLGPMNEMPIVKEFNEFKTKNLDGSSITVISETKIEHSVEVSENNTDKKNVKQNKNKKNKNKNKNKQVKENVEESLPNFKQRAKEILEIDESEEVKSDKLENDNKEIVFDEEIEILNIDFLPDELNNATQFDGQVIETDWENDTQPLEVKSIKEIEAEIDNLVENTVKEAEENAAKIDAQIEADIKKMQEELDSKVFNAFDENIEVIEEEEVEEAETVVAVEPNSFIKYNEEVILSEGNTLDEFLDSDSKDFRMETLKTLFYNGCLVCVERFKDNIFKIKGRRSFTTENIKAAFYDGYSELIDYTHAFLTKEGICDNSIDKDTLFEKIFGLQCLDTLSKQIKKVNIMIDNEVSEKEILNSIDRSIGIYRANSDKDHFKTDVVRSISRDIKTIFEEAKTDYSLRDNIEQGIYRLILEAVEFINKCGLANFDLFTEDYGRTLNELLKSKAKVRETLGKFQNNRRISDEEYIKILQDAIISYPFFEDTYVALSMLEIQNLRRYDLLNSAFELLDKCGEKADKVLEEIRRTEVELYFEELQKIPANADNILKKLLCTEKMKLYNITNPDVVFEAEIHQFGYIVSDIDIQSVSESARLSTFKRELLKIRDENLDEEERHRKILESKEEYLISDWDCFKAEYSVFGRSFAADVFSNLDKEDRISILDYCMKSILEVANTDSEKKILLNELQQRDILDKKNFRDIEKEVFGNIIPLTEEEEIEFEFIQGMNQVYAKYENEIKALDIKIIDDKWNMEVPGFYQLISEMQTDYEPVLFAYTEESKSGKNKEGFVITDRAIYSSYAKKSLKLYDIESLKVRNYSKVKKGERISYEGIFIDVDHRDYKLCSNYMGVKEIFADMLNDIIDIYRDVNGFVPLEKYETKAEDEMILGIDSENILLSNKRLQEELKVNLEENKYYELMSDLLNYDNLSFKEILLELSKLVNKEASENKIYFNEITEGSGEKIKEACTSYVQSISDLEEIYLVIDNSKKFLLQLQTHGLVISSKGIYCKNKLEEAWFMDLKYATNIKTKEDNKIQITNRVVEFPFIKKKQDLYDLRDLIEFIVVVRRIMDNPLEEIDQEINSFANTPADKFILDLVNSIKSQNLRKMLYVHSEGAASEKKYAAAMTTYADLDDTEKPMLLLDTTVFGLKASGLLVTDKNIYYKEARANGLDMSILAISRIYIKNEKFYINGIEFKLSGLDIKEKTELCEKITKLVDYLKSGFKKAE
ncbi:MAG: hypothetical protein ACRCYE_14465 [Sarcina sp.]